MKKWKRACVMAAAGVFGLMMAACGSKELDESEIGAGLSGVTLRLSHGLSKEHPIQAALEQFAQEIHENTDGEITVRIYPNATLGSEKDNLEQLPIGALDIAKVSASALESFSPVYQAFSVPYIFNSEEHFYGFMDSEEAQELYMSTADKGYIALTWFDSGARSFYTVDTPVNTPADLKGLKIRTMDSPMAFEMMECFGGSATTMSISDVFTGMQSGVIDGAENNETALTNGGHGEVAKCYSYDTHTRIPDILLLRYVTWQKMSDEQKQIVKTAADNAKETYKEKWQEAIRQAVEDAKQMGVEFNEPDLAPFQEAVKPIYDRLAEESPEIWEICEQIQNFK